MKLARVTETGMAPPWQGVTTENVGICDPARKSLSVASCGMPCRSNAAGASPRAPRDSVHWTASGYGSRSAGCALATRGDVAMMTRGAAK